MKFLVAGVIGVALVLAVAAFAATTGNSRSSGLHGVVRIDPGTPVCKVGQPCTRPAARVWLVFSRRGKTVARTRTGRDGAYRVALSPGTYNVISPRTRLEPTRVAVASGRYKRVVFKLDIGLR
jgi:hypothetical protein